MFGLSVSQPLPIGLDIGHDSIKMLQLAVNGESLSVLAASRHIIDPEVRQKPDSLLAYSVNAIRQMLKSGGFKGRDVVTCLPRDIVHVKNLRLPMMPLADLAAVVQFEARNVFSFDTDQARVEFLPAGEVRQGADVRQEVIALAARHEDVDRFLEQLHHSGIVVDSLDVEPCALYRGIERFVRRREDEQEVYVLVDVGLRRSQVLIGKGRDISFVKPIEIGGGKFHEAVSRKLGISFDEARALRRRLTEAHDTAPTGRDPVRQAVFDATRSTMEELSREVSLCLRYYSVTFRGHRPARVRLVGGEGADPQLLAILASALPVPVEAGRPLFSVDSSTMKSAEQRGPGSHWSLALGLSLKRTTGNFKPLDGTPRAAQSPLPPTAEIIDLNAAIAPPGPRESAGAHAARQSDARAATATARQTPAVSVAGVEAIHA